MNNNMLYDISGRPFTVVISSDANDSGVCTRYVLMNNNCFRVLSVSELIAKHSLGIANNIPRVKCEHCDGEGCHICEGFGFLFILSL